MNFEFYFPVKIIAEENAIASLQSQLMRFKVRRPLVMCGKIIRKCGICDAVLEQIKPPVKCGGVFDDIEKESSLKTTEAAAAFYKDKACDSIIAVGGGSILDTAKAVRLLLSQESDNLKSMEGIERFRNARNIPFFVFPTTAGTGSEATNVSVIADRENGVKLEFVSDVFYPDVAFLEPSFTLSLSKKKTASGAIDAICHAVEAYTSKQANPISDELALQAIEGFSCCDIMLDALDDTKLRLRALRASLYAGAAFSNAMVGLAHALAHAAGGTTGIAHDIAVGIFLPKVMRFNMSVCQEKYARLFAAFDKTAFEISQNPAEDFAAKIESFIMKAGLPTHLKDAGAIDVDAERITERCLLDGACLTNARTAKADDVRAIVKEAL